MNVTVTVFHNVAKDDEGRSLASFRGYDTGHTVTPVFRYEYDAGDEATYAAVCEYAFFLFNVGDDPNFGTVQQTSLNYRQRRLRSLSVGDVVSIDCPHTTKFFACQTFGWLEINAPAMVYGVDDHGTHSDDTLRAVHHG